MKKMILLTLVVLAGIATWRSVVTARAMAEKVDYTYSIPETTKLWMDESPEGEIVRTATAFKFDRSAIQILAIVNTVIFTLAIIATVMEFRKKKPQPKNSANPLNPGG